MLVVVFFEEVGDNFGNFRLALHIHAEQVAVHAVVHGTTDGVERILRGIVAKCVVRRSIKVAVVAAQTRFGVSGVVNVVAGGFCRLLPFILVGIGPATEQIDECRQAVGGIAPSVVAVCRLECSDEISFAVQGAAIAFPACFQNCLRVFHVAFVVPAVSREQERHHEVDFAVGGVSLVAGRTVAVRLPRKVAVATSSGVMPQMAFGPIPKLFKFIFVVGLHGNHHAITHAFGTDIVVVDIDNVATIAVFVIHSLIILAAKIVVPEFVKLVLDIFICLTQDGLERAGVIASVVGTSRLGTVFFAIRTVVGILLVKEGSCVYFGVGCCGCRRTQQQSERECR